MATKKRKGKGKSGSDPLSQLMGFFGRADVMGVALMLISIFTLLSLFTGSRGSLTGAWIDGLEQAFGVGVWGFPLVTAALALWLVIHAMERMEDMAWQRPLGAALLFIAFVTGANRLMEGQVTDGGGWLGMQLSQGIDDIAGGFGVWAFVATATVIGIFLLTDQLLIELVRDGWDELQDWRYRRGERSLPPIEPSTPIPSGELPWHKRLREQWDDFLVRMRPAPVRERSQPPVISAAPAGPRMVEPAPSSPRSNGGATRTAPAAPAKTVTPPKEDGDILTPRIVGGAQEWRLPRLGDMLSDWERAADSDDLIRQQGRLIQETLALFGVPADFEGAYKGPAVTQYLIKPGYVERTVAGERKRQKIKVAKIAALANDLALALAAPSVRIEAPIPGTNYVGVEVPNRESNVVGLKELMESDEFQKRKGKLLIALGEDVKGQPVITDMARMPHLLIAGATGSGKSVCINAIITGLLLTHTPDTLRLLMVDPKMVELSVYNGVPHLLSPVVTEVDKAAAVLYWAVKEMERRYSLLSKVNARDLERYNEYLLKRGEKRLPYIVVVVDEMADLMMAAPEEVEKHICRLAQMARAVGIHLIIATQRPSVDVITGLIKANFPARIAFAVTSQTDSRVILDIPGAERLLGRGDMLFMAPDASKLERLQGTWLSDEEINRTVRYWKGIRSYDDMGPATGTPPEVAASKTDEAGAPAAPANALPTLPPPTSKLPQKLEQAELFEQVEAMKSVDARDELFDDAVRAVAEAQRGSVSLLQRKLRIGYSRAGRLVEQLEEAGVLGPDQGGSLGRAYLGEARDDAAPAPPLSAQPDEETAQAQQSGQSSEPRIWF
ncbi:MAG: DNA translocase FtsK 4TM domain-containing protein [Caldilineaceae bacterium]|nr:DNA translocase FtsK 4TM domain-containing protein [Caldilineaceae bacterium]